MPNSAIGWFQLLDSALPIGGFAHSFGLETAVQRHSVQTIHDLKKYILSQLQHSWASLDLNVLRAQRNALTTGHLSEFIEWDQKIAAQRLARESREGQRKMGRQLMQLAMRWDPQFEIGNLQQILSESRAPGMHLSVYAWLTHYWNIPLLDAGIGYLYTNCSMTIQAAIRLISIGQMDGQTLLYQLQPTIQEVATTILAADRSSHFPTAPNPHTWAWMQELDAMAHEGLYSRLFMS